MVRAFSFQPIIKLKIMNITPLTVYFWQQADTICSFFHGLGIAGIIISIISLIIFAGVKDENSESPYLSTISKVIKFVLIPMTIISWLTFALFPRSNTIAMMVVIPELANSKMIKEDLPQIYDVAIDALKKQLAPKN